MHKKTQVLSLREKRRTDFKKNQSISVWRTEEFQKDFFGKIFLPVTSHLESISQFVLRIKLTNVIKKQNGKLHSVLESINLSQLRSMR